MRRRGQCSDTRALSLHVTFIKFPEDWWHVTGCSRSCVTLNSKAVCSHRNAKTASEFCFLCPLWVVGLLLNGGEKKFKKKN